MYLIDKKHIGFAGELKMENDKVSVVNTKSNSYH